LFNALPEPGILDEMAERAPHVFWIARHMRRKGH